MKTIPAALQAELNRPTSRLARCIKITRTDGRVFGFTTAREVKSFGGINYEPAYSFAPSDISTGSNMDIDDGQAGGLLDSGTITEDDIRATRWDYAAFELFRINWASPDDGVIKDRAGHLGKITVSHATFQAELLGMMEGYSIGIMKFTQPGCRTSLGTEDCGVVPTTVSGTVESMDDDYFTLNDSARAEATGFFDEGRLTIHFPSGDLSYEVKTYTPGVWVTKTMIHYDATGVAYTMSEGCTRRFEEDCVARFANGINFRGEPWLRGNDALAQVGRRS